MTTSLNRNPSTVSAARRQWLDALSAAETAERIYNAAIENGLPETAGLLVFSTDGSACPECREPNVHHAACPNRGGE